MRSDGSDEFEEHDYGHVHEDMEARIGPRRRTHLQEVVQPAIRLTIGSREFGLDARRDPAAIRILLVERDLLVRAALAALIRNWKGFHVVAEARTIKQAIAHQTMSPDVVLVSLAGGADTSMVVELALKYGPDRLVVLLGQDAEDQRFEIGRHAHRVLMKSAQPHTLRKAIDGIPPL
jgi:hypothetical protein